MTQRGFTLLELIVVMVILGILGAIAIPQFVDLESEASQAAVDGIAGALNSAAALNYAACRASSNECVKKISDCSRFGKNPVLLGGLDRSYQIKTKSLGHQSGDTVTCTVIHAPSGLSASFTGITP